MIDDIYKKEINTSILDIIGIANDLINDLVLIIIIIKV